MRWVSERDNGFYEALNKGLRLRDVLAHLQT